MNSDSKEVAAQFQGSDIGNCAGVNSTVALSKTALVHAKCLAEFWECSSITSKWNISSIDAVVQIAAPSSAINPSVVISSASTVGYCDPVIVDTTSSQGSGGRQWSSIKYSLSGGSSSTSAELQRVLDEASKAKLSTLVIPAQLVEKGLVYGISVVVRNFLGMSSSAYKNVLVLNNAIPFVSIAGPSYRTASRSSLFSLSASAYVSLCSGETTVMGLAYKWTVFRDGTPDLSIVSSSSDDSKFRLNPYSLSVSKLYEVKLSVLILATQQESSAVVKAFVQQVLKISSLISITLIIAVSSHAAYPCV